MVRFSLILGFFQWVTAFSNRWAGGGVLVVSWLHLRLPRVCFVSFCGSLSSLYRSLVFFKKSVLVSGQTKNTRFTRDLHPHSYLLLCRTGAIVILIHWRVGQEYVEWKNYIEHNWQLIPSTGWGVIKCFRAICQSAYVSLVSMFTLPGYKRIIPLVLIILTNAWFAYFGSSDWRWLGPTL